MRVLITSEFYYPHVGGAEKVVQILAEGLVERGHEVTVATTELPVRTHKYLNGVFIEEFALKGNKAKFIKEVKKGEVDRYKNFLLTSKYDVIFQYAAQTWHTDLAFEVLTKVNAKKILIPCGFSGLTTWTRRLIYHEYFKKMPSNLAKYDKLVFLSESYLDTQFAIRHQLTNYSIIPNGIYVKEFEQNQVNFRERYGIPSNKKMILNVSNHYKLKGHQQLINAFCEVNYKEDTILVIIGNDPGGSTSCNEKCTHLASDNKDVYLLSDVPREFVISAYIQTDLFVLSSYIEYYPLVLIEAMYCKKPIVSMNVGCVKDYCECLLVDEYKNLSLNIKKGLQSFPEAMIQSNYQRVIDQLVWERIIDQYNSLIS